MLVLSPPTMVHRNKPVHGRPIRPHNLRRPRNIQVFEQDVPRVYPFMLGYGGMGMANPEEVMDQPGIALVCDWYSSRATPRNWADSDGAKFYSSDFQLISDSPYPCSVTDKFAVSPDSDLNFLDGGFFYCDNDLNPVHYFHLVPYVDLDKSTSVTPSTSFSSTSFSSTSSSSIEIITSVSLIPSPSATSAPQLFKEKHPYALYAAFGLMMLILLCVICASIAWIIRRRRRRRVEAENQQWIGSVLNDEPDNMDARELEKGRGTVEPGIAGIGAVRREPTYPPLTPPLLSSWHFQDTPIPSNGNGTFGTHYGLPPAHVYQPWRHSSPLQRGGPTTIDGVRYGLDGGGLTFRQDPNGGLTFDPRGTCPNEAVSYPNPHAPPAPVSTAPSHYSYGGAGPFAVTNLMPGDISSRASETSLGRQTGETSLDRLVPPGLGNNATGSPARSLGLPTGPLDDPSPWRRYEGVENRGGATGTEDNDKGWGATIRSGIYSAVGKIVGGDEAKPAGNEETKSVEREKDRFTELVKKRRPRREWKAGSDKTPSECEEVHIGVDHDKPDDDTDGVKATVLADSGRYSLGMDKSGDGHPINWLDREPAQHMMPDSRGWVVEESPDGSRGKIHIVAAGARDRILRRLGSNTSVATWTTVYSTDEDPVFSSESGTTSRTNTIATSRRDTISTRKSGCVGMDRSREASTTSSDWGTMSVARALGMSFAGRTRDDKHGN
ncbi:hypothetical protein RSAG8_05414, partial [Rhizoctonia solani AG-8 WAC10335]